MLQPGFTGLNNVLWWPRYPASYTHYVGDSDKSDSVRFGVSWLRKRKKKVYQITYHRKFLKCMFWQSVCVGLRWTDWPNWPSGNRVTYINIKNSLRVGWLQFHCIFDSELIFRCSERRSTRLKSVTMWLTNWVTVLFQIFWISHF